MCIVDSSLFAEKEPDMLTPFTVLMPANIRFGRGQAESAAPWLAQQGGPILLVHGASPQRAAFLRQQLETLQLAVTTLAISREPWLSDIEQGVQLAREKGIRAVVSLGGGAVIDAGKAIAALVPAAGPVIDYLEVVGTGRQLEASPLPFVAIPTTAGTGAEATKNAVINVPEQQRKVSLRDDRMLPDLAIVDPALTDNAPRSITLSSGLDALTQVIEPWLCSRATPFTDALCQQAIPRGIRALKILMEQECPASRDEMAWVSLCGGLALANAGLGVIHGLAGPLGGLSRASHGALCGSLLPFGLALNESQINDPGLRQRVNDVRRWLADGLDVPVDRVWDSLREWSHRAGLGTLRDLGVARDALEPAALAASTSSSMKANPVSLNGETLVTKKLVIASGGLSMPGLGASPFGYKVAEQFGLKVLPTRAGLVPFTLHKPLLEQLQVLSGVSVPSTITAENGTLFRENLLFTHRGLSGPAVLQISSYWQPGEFVTVNLLPDCDLDDFLNEQRSAHPNQSLKNTLAMQLPKRLVECLQQLGQIPDVTLKQLNVRDQQTLVETLTAWRVQPNGTEGYRTAEVTLGGVDTNELSSRTMEARKAPGLYFIGEVMDVTGWLGGYNFQWAWSSAWACAQALVEG